MTPDFIAENKGTAASVIRDREIVLVGDSIEISMTESDIHSKLPSLASSFLKEVVELLYWNTEKN